MELIRAKTEFILTVVQSKSADEMSDMRDASGCKGPRKPTITSWELLSKPEEHFLLKFIELGDLNIQYKAHNESFGGL
jgi:hypothetical protein